MTTRTRASGKSESRQRATVTPTPRRRRSSTAPAPNSHARIDVIDRRRMIEEAAYRRAESRGFQGADPMDDWLAAEREVDELLARSPTSP